MTDMTGKLRRFERQHMLAETPSPKSLMPDNYSQLLSPTEDQDLVAYLKTLKARDLAKTIKSISRRVELRPVAQRPGRAAELAHLLGRLPGHHLPSLRQITPANVKRLQAQWSLQMPPGPQLEATPLVVDGTMYTTYTTSTSGGVYAIDAKVASDLEIRPASGSDQSESDQSFQSWSSGFGQPRLLRHARRRAGRARRTQRPGSLGNPGSRYDDRQFLHGAPLALNNKIIVGIAGGEFGIRGFIDAYDPATGKRLWRFDTIPGPGEFGHEPGVMTAGSTAAALRG